MANTVLELTASMPDMDGGHFTLMVGPDDVTFYLPEGRKLAVSHDIFSNIQHLLRGYQTATELVAGTGA